MMKRWVSSIIVFILAAALFTGCGRQEEVSGDRDTPEPESSGVSKVSESPSPEPSATATPAIEPQTPEPARPSQLMPFSNGEEVEALYGYMDPEGKVVIEPVFTMAKPFRACGLAVVRGDEGKAGLIDKTGKYVVEPKSDYFFHSEDLILGYSYEHNRTYAYDESGRLLFEKEGYIASFSDGLAVSYLENEKGYIDKTGKLVLKLPYDNLGPFKDGYASVSPTYSDPEFLIDKNGNDVTDTVSSGLRMIRDASTNLYGFSDMDGNPVIDCKFVYAEPFRDGLSIVCLNYEATGWQYGIIDKTGNYVLKPIYTGITRLRNGSFAVGPKVIEGEYPPPEVYDHSPKAIFSKDLTRFTDFIITDLADFDKTYVCVSDGKEVYYLDSAIQRADKLPVFKGKGLMLPDGDLLSGTLDGCPTVADRGGNIIMQDRSLRVLGDGIHCVTETIYPDAYSEIRYPVIEGMTDVSLQDKINGIIRDEAMSAIRLPDAEYDDPYAILILNVNSSVILKKNLLQIETGVDEYMMGAAHGSYYLDVRFVDIANGREYTLRDLFKSPDDALAHISSIISDRMRDEPDNYFDAEAGVTPEQVKFFYLNNEGITVYFGLYEITPYVAGMPEFEISFEEMSDYIDYDGEFWKSFN